MGLYSYNILPINFCDYLINLYETDTGNHERVDKESKPTFTQLNLNKYHANVVSNLCNYFSVALDFYKKDVPQAKYLPQVKYLEEFRIKKYAVGGQDRFDEHVDVTDFDSSIRAVAFLFYLNDNDGNTLFSRHGLNIRPVSGRVLVFPPTWDYPHSGLAPKSNPKYIMSTYIHYGKN